MKSDATGWISVRDALPELIYRDDSVVELDGRAIPPLLISGSCLVVVEGYSEAEIDALVQLENASEVFWRVYGGDRVTHWMPLPALPRGDQV